MERIQFGLAILRDTSAASVGLFLLICYGRIPFRRWALVAAILPTSFIVLPFFLHLSTTMGAVYDPSLMAFESRLGLPSARIAVLFSYCKPLYYACFFVYYSLPLVVTFAAACELRSRQRLGLGVMPTFAVAAVIGFSVYWLVPAVGPFPYFGSAFPLSLQEAATAGNHADFSWAPRNCMPSLHLTWAALAFLAMRRRHVLLCATSGLLCVLTGLATLGLGEHYLIDLVTAVPFILLIRSLCAVQVPWADRRIGFLAGVSMTLGWCFAVRYGLPPLVMSTLLIPLIVGSTGLSIMLEQRLGRREDAVLGLPREGGGILGLRWQARRAAPEAS